MNGTDHSEELNLQRLNALCRLCARKSDKAFDDREIILCKTYATELLLFIKLIPYLTQHPHIQKHYVGLVTCV